MTVSESIDLVALLKAQASDDLDFLREGVRVLAHALMEEEITQHVGAKRHARTTERTGQRTGHRERQWDTRVGSLTFLCRAWGTAATSRCCWNRVGVPNVPCSRWCRKPSRTAFASAFPDSRR